MNYLNTPTGWECPVCNIGVAPTSMVCPECVRLKGKPKTSTGTGYKKVTLPTDFDYLDNGSNVAITDAMGKPLIVEAGSRGYTIE